MLVSRLGGDAQPFVLLDDARAQGAAPARLFTDLVTEHQAHAAADVALVLDQIEAAQRAGHYVAGYLNYEAGKGLDSAWRGDGQAGAEGDDPAPLAWFGVFRRMETIAPQDVAAHLPDGAGAWVGSPQPQMGRAEYLAAVDELLGLIAAGDIYQANYTFQAKIPYCGDALAVYARLRDTARAGYGGFIWTGQQAIASLSPELFFSLRGGQVMARPMKGTAPRLADERADAAAAAGLKNDPKQRAENLMIVDLIRNDLSRVAQAGSVRVPDLFRVESFPTIHQLVSDVTADLPDGASAVDVLRAAFPCGSITGAPKIRAMEIIDQLEQGPRGLYTGSIGFLEPSGDAAFNVAIRTLVFPHGQGAKTGAAYASMGLGSGIVADSKAADEWRECLAKGEFVTAASETFDLLETLAFDPVEGLIRLDRHLARMAQSAEHFGFRFNRHDARNRLQAATFRARLPSKVRIRLGRSGAMAVEVTAFAQQSADVMRVAVAPAPLMTGDFRVRHKTSLRGVYDQCRKESGAAEVVFVDADGFVTEGSYTNIFVDRDGVLLTPPLDKALLAGVLRAELLETGQASESPLRIEDLEHGFFIGNSLRGLIPAELTRELV
jgi:para-aminobenzoate synthetase/4-amino-4-deoxychorismate lyase